MEQSIPAFNPNPTPIGPVAGADTPEQIAVKQEVNVRAPVTNVVRRKPL
jgi:hypothetical protein